MVRFEIKGYLDVDGEDMWSDDDTKAWFKSLLKNGGLGLYLHSNEVGGSVGSFESIELLYEMVDVR